MKELYVVDDFYVEPSDSFIYQVFIYVHNNDCIRLENTRTYLSEVYINKIVLQDIRKFKNGYIHKITELVGAPLNWLKENSTKIVFEETTKDKKLRLKNK